MEWGVLATLVLTLAAIMLRPRGLPEAAAAAAGALAMFLLGAVRLADIERVLNETSDVLLFLFGMMVLSWLAEQAGVFEWLAERVIRLARGSGPLLLGLVFVLGGLITTFLSLDVTVLILTPIIFALAGRRRLDPLPFMFACVFVANTGSLTLPISNLTNLLAYDQLQLGFADFAGVMWLPNLAAMLTNVLVFRWLFRDRLPTRFTRTRVPLPHADWWLLTAAVILSGTLLALVILGLNRLPLAWAALAGGGGLWLIGLAGRRVRRGQMLAATSWPIFIFVAGMFLVVSGFEHTWLSRFDLPLARDPAAALVSAVGLNAVGSNIVNNIPMTLAAVPVIERAGPVEREALTYGTLLGVNIGSTLTTFGSIATMLWLGLLRDRGLRITTGDYMKVAVITTPLILLAATITLWLVLR